MTREEVSAAVRELAFPVPAWRDWREATKQQKQEHQEQKQLFYTACEETCRTLRHAADQDVFDVLFARACALDESPDFGLQNIAGHLLLCSKPRCPISCPKACRIISRSDWNVSVQEVPWYLASFFGTEAVYLSMNELEQETDVQEARAAVEACWKMHTFHKGTVRQFAEWYRERQQEAPRDDVGNRLSTIRYWTDILVRGPEDILADWKPFWR